MIKNQNNFRYNPCEPLRKDFNADIVYRNDKGNVIIDDPDIHFIMKYYRRKIKKGTLLNVGAGTTHLHYMAAIVDKLTHITALDISPINISLINELYQSLKNNTISQNQYINQQDVETLKMLIEAIADDVEYGKDRTFKDIMQDLIHKTSNPDGRLDIAANDMYNLSCFKSMKFDNILLSFSLFVQNDENDLEYLFSNLYNGLNPQGHIIIIDFGDPSEGEFSFTDDDLDEFHEDRVALKNYHTNFRLDDITLARCLTSAGFSSINIDKTELRTNSEEKARGFFYLTAYAKK